MTRDEIVTALRRCAKNLLSECPNCKMFHEANCVVKLKTAAVDLIENQQRHIEALLQANAALRDTVLRRDAQIADMSDGLAQFAKAVAVKEENNGTTDCT